MVSIRKFKASNKVNNSNRISFLTLRNLTEVVTRKSVIRKRKETEACMKKVEAAKKHHKKRKTSSTKASSSSLNNRSREERILASLLEKDPPEDLKAMVEEKHGRNLVLVITKKVFKCDISKNHMRFQMPISKVTRDEGFLSNEERDGLSNKKYIKVRLVGPKFEKEEEMEIRTWNGCYVLTTTGWRNALEKYNGELAIGDFVKVWSFRCNDGNELWLRIVIYRAKKDSEVVLQVG